MATQINPLRSVA